MRMLATISIQPHLSKGKNMTPEKLLPLPWDKVAKRGYKKQAGSELTPEQQRERMAKLVEKLGDQTI